MVYLLAVAAGASFVIQQAVNSNLRAEVGSAWWAGLISYVGGSLSMLAVIVLLREPAPTGRMIATSSLLSWTGGVFGAIYIAVSILLSPKLGTATVVALIVLGQMLGSLVFDHFGLFGVPVHEVTAARLAGAACLLLGVILIRY